MNIQIIHWTKSLNHNLKMISHIKALKDLLFVSNQVTQYFFFGLSPNVNKFDMKSKFYQAFHVENIV